MNFLRETSVFMSDVTLTSIDLFDLIGILGFCLYLINYSLVTFQKIDSRGIAFFLTNIVAASCVLVSLMQSFNLASALIQVFWICLGVVAITLRLLPRLKLSTTSQYGPHNIETIPANQNAPQVSQSFTEKKIAMLKRICNFKANRKQEVTSPKAIKTKSY